MSDARVAPEAEAGADATAAASASATAAPLATRLVAVAAAKDGADDEESASAPRRVSGTGIGAQKAVLMSHKLLAATRSGDMESVVRLLDEGVDPLTELGVFGETALHVAVLMHTQHHMAIARVLLERGGTALANAEYKEPLFKGETALHLAIVKRDMPFVKLLLRAGADLHARATGSFFASDGGECPFGELPLSFAAATGQPAMVKALLRAGARLDLTDSHGDTAAHVAVRFSRGAVYELLVRVDRAAGGDVANDRVVTTQGMGLRAARNEDGFTPLTLAASLGDPATFQAALNGEREELWSYDTVRGAAYPLQPIEEALHVMVEAGSDDLTVVPLVRTAMEWKWERFGRRAFSVDVWERIIYLAVFSYAAINSSTLNTKIEGGDTSDHDHHDHAGEVCYWLSVALLLLFCIREVYRWRGHMRQLARTIGGKREQGLATLRAARALHATGSHGRAARLAAGHAGIRMAKAALHAKAEQRRRACLRAVYRFFAFECGDGIVDPGGLKRSPEYLTYVHVALFLSSVPLRVTGGIVWGDNLLALSCICGWTSMASYLASHPLTGSLVAMTVVMLVHDVTIFLAIFCLVLAGFSQAFQLLMRGAPTVTNFADIGSTLRSLILISLGDWTWEDLDESHTPWLAKTVFWVFLLLSTVLLLNLLIALFADTFNAVNERAEISYRFAWSRIILRYQERLTDKEQALHSLADPDASNAEVDVTADGDVWVVTERISEAELAASLAADRRPLPKRTVASSTRKSAAAAAALGDDDEHVAMGRHGGAGVGMGDLGGATSSSPTKVVHGMFRGDGEDSSDDEDGTGFDSALQRRSAAAASERLEAMARASGSERRIERLVGGSSRNLTINR